MPRQPLRIAVLALSFLGCKSKPTEEPEKPAGSGTATMAAPEVAPQGSAAGSAGSGAGSGSDAIAIDPGALQTPESVLYDVGRDMYMVSNINGKEMEADNNGYLTVVNPDGSNERANANWKWIVGGMPDIKLDAPKGMAISGDTLYVADVTVVRRFEAKAGRQKDDVKIDGASFLNDVAPDGTGGVFVSDTGVGTDEKPNGTDAVYHIDKDGKVTTRIKNKDLGGPNGLWFDGKGSVWVVTFLSGEIYEVNAKGKKGTATKLPKGGLDGIVQIEGGDFLVSSWEGKCIYRGKPGGEWKVVVKDVESPADIDYDPKRKRVLIPGFNTNKLIVYPL